MTEVTKTPEFTLADVKRTYFPIEKLAIAETEAQKAMDAAGKIADAKVVFNFDPDKGLPDGYGMAIIPIGKKAKNEKGEDVGERITIGVCIAAIPTLAELQKTAEGVDYITNSIADALVTRVANAVRPRADGSTAHVIPSIVADFITSNRPEGVLAGYNSVAPAWVTLLRNKGMTLLTKELLRSILSSTAFASTGPYAKVPQTTWVTILEGMIASAAKANLTTVAMQDWLTTRDTSGMPHKDDVDLSDLDFSKM